MDTKRWTALAVAALLIVAGCATLTADPVTTLVK